MFKSYWIHTWLVPAWIRCRTSRTSYYRIYLLPLFHDLLHITRSPNAAIILFQAFFGRISLDLNEVILLCLLGGRESVCIMFMELFELLLVMFKCGVSLACGSHLIMNILSQSLWRMQEILGTSFHNLFVMRNARRRLHEVRECSSIMISCAICCCSLVVYISHAEVLPTEVLCWGNRLAGRTSCCYHGIMLLGRNSSIPVFHLLDLNDVIIIYDESLWMLILKDRLIISIRRLLYCGLLFLRLYPHDWNPIVPHWSLQQAWLECVKIAARKLLRRGIKDKLVSVHAFATVINFDAFLWLFVVVLNMDWAFEVYFGSSAIRVMLDTRLLVEVLLHRAFTDSSVRYFNHRRLPSTLGITLLSPLEVCDSIVRDRCQVLRRAHEAWRVVQHCVARCRWAIWAVSLIADAYCSLLVCVDLDSLAKTSAILQHAWSWQLVNLLLLLTFRNWWLGIILLLIIFLHISCRLLISMMPSLNGNLQRRIRKPIRQPNRRKHDLFHGQILRNPLRMALLHIYTTSEIQSIAVVLVDSNVFVSCHLGFN